MPCLLVGAQFVVGRLIMSVALHTVGWQQHRIAFSTVNYKVKQQSATETQDSTHEHRDEHPAPAPNPNDTNA